jgi:EamA domain-containing membrane protein RarD
MFYVCPTKLTNDVFMFPTANSTRLVLKRKLSNLQWMAIVLLAVGTTTSQVCYYHEPSLLFL